MAENQNQSIGAHIAQVIRDASELVHAEIKLAKSELQFSLKAGGVAIGAVLAALFMLFMVIVLASITFAYFLTMTGMHAAWAFLIVTGLYVLGIVALLAVAYFSAKKVRAPERTITTVKKVSEQFSKE